MSLTRMDGPQARDDAVEGSCQQDVRSPQSVDNVQAGSEEVGARRRLAPTDSTLRVKPDGAKGPSPCAQTRLTRRYRRIRGSLASCRLFE
jgi:hypothetical protein